MASWWLGWTLLATFLMVPAQLCEIPKDHLRLIRSLNLKLLRATQDGSTTLNPSVHVGLRLSKEHSLEKEKEYLQRLKETFQPSKSSAESMVPTVNFSTGQIALYLLALRASCEDLETKEGKKLITRLKQHLHDEKTHIATEGTPVSNYYQYSMGILALCVNNKKVDVHVIQKLLHAENQNKFTVEGGSSVDTDAIAGMAFLCLERSSFYMSDLDEKLIKALERVKGKIIASKGDDGVFGNIYSTALAIQFLSSSKTDVIDTVCPDTVTALIKGVRDGRFSNPMTMSQLMPVLNRRTYLDIATMDCTGDDDSLMLPHGATRSRRMDSEGEKILVKLKVENPINQTPEHKTSLKVSPQSSLLDVLNEAQARDPKRFTYETQESLSGLFLITVGELKADPAKRTYLQLLKDPHTSITEGIADYRPENGETIIIRLAKW